MGPVRQVEVVDRHGRVIHQIPFDDSAFPLTVRVTGDAPEPAASSPAPASASARWSDRTRALLAGAVAAVVFGAIAWIRTPSTSPGASAIGGAIGLMIFVSVYAGAWALGGTLAKNRGHFARHFTWACGVALAFTLLSYLAYDALFFAPSPIMYAPVTLLWIAFAVVAITGQLGIASSMPRSRRRRIAAVVAGCALGLAALGAYTDGHEFSTKLSYVGGIQPFSARLIPAESPDEFAKSLDGVRTELDKAAARH